MSITFTQENPMHLVLSNVPCYQSLNLLAHAQLEEINVGSLCGGHGICGKDKIRPLPHSADFLSPLTEIEKKHLSPDEIKNGWRLGCQCWPEANDLEIQIVVPKLKQQKL